MKLTEQELGEIRIMHDIIKQAQWKLALVKGNTALIASKERGKKDKERFNNFLNDWIEVEEGVIKVLNTAKEDFISSVCATKGIKGRVSIDLGSGEITQKDE